MPTDVTSVGRPIRCIWCDDVCYAIVYSCSIIDIAVVDGATLLAVELLTFCMSVA